jgi:hypothetical protein
MTLLKRAKEKNYARQQFVFVAFVYTNLVPIARATIP